MLGLTARVKLKNFVKSVKRGYAKKQFMVDILVFQGV